MIPARKRKAEFDEFIYWMMKAADFAFEATEGMEGGNFTPNFFQKSQLAQQAQAKALEVVNQDTNAISMELFDSLKRDFAELAIQKSKVRDRIAAYEAGLPKTDFEIIATLFLQMVLEHIAYGEDWIDSHICREDVLEIYCLGCEIEMMLSSGQPVGTEEEYYWLEEKYTKEWADKNWWTFQQESEE